MAAERMDGRTDCSNTCIAFVAGNCNCVVSRRHWQPVSCLVAALFLLLPPPQMNRFRRVRLSGPQIVLDDDENSFADGCEAAAAVEAGYVRRPLTWRRRLCVRRLAVAAV